MLGFVRDIRPKVPPDNAVPRGVIFLVELLLNIRSNILQTARVMFVLSNDIASILGKGVYLLNIIFL